MSFVNVVPDVVGANGRGDSGGAGAQGAQYSGLTGDGGFGGLLAAIRGDGVPTGVFFGLPLVTLSQLASLA